MRVGIHCMYHYSLLRQEIERCCTSLLMAPSSGPFFLRPPGEHGTYSCYAQASKTEVVAKGARRSAHFHQACEHFKDPCLEDPVLNVCLAGNLAFHWWAHIPDEHCQLSLWNVGMCGLVLARWTELPRQLPLGKLPSLQAPAVLSVPYDALLDLGRRLLELRLCNFQMVWRGQREIRHGRQQSRNSTRRRDYRVCFWYAMRC